VSTNSPFSKIIAGAIPGPIFFMHGLKFAESLQFYQSDRQKLKTIEIVTENIKVYKTVFLNSLTTLHSDCKVRKYGQNIQ
jgi:hypothetical protein